MSEAANFILERIGVILSGQSEEMLQISEELKGFCSTIEAFQPLIEIILSQNQESFKRESVLLLSFLLDKIYSSETEVSEEIWAAIFQALFSPTTTAAVRADIMSNIVERFKIFSTLVIFQTAAPYISQSLEEAGTELDVDFSLQLVSILSKETSEITGMGEQVLALTQKGLQYGQASLTYIHALRAGIIFCNMFSTENIGGYLELLAPEAFVGLDDNNYVEFCKLLSWIAEEGEGGIEGFDPVAILTPLLEITSNAEVSNQKRKSSHEVIVALFRNFDSLIEGDEIPLAAFQATLSLAEALFNEEDALDMTPYELLEIASYFAQRSELLQSFIGTFGELTDSALGCFCISEFIFNSAQKGIIFYEQNIEEIMQLLLTFLQAECMSIRESAARSIALFAEEIPDAIRPYAETINTTIFAAFAANVSIEMLTALHDVLSKTKETDCIFDEALPALVELISQSQSDNTVLTVIADLVSGSNEKAMENFEAIFTMVSTILHDSENPLMADAVFLLSRLCFKCPEQFEPYVDEISEFLIQGFDSEDSSIAINFINAYSYIVQNFPEHCEEVANDVVAKLAELSPFESSDEEIVIDRSDIALRTGTYIASTFPATFPPVAEAFLEAIRMKKNIHSAIAATFFITALDSFDDMEYVAPFIFDIVPILTDIIEKGSSQASGQAFTAAADAFEKLLTIEGSEELQVKLVNCSCKAFTFDLQCLLGYNIFNDELHPSALELLTTAIKNGIVQPVLENVQSLIQFCEGTESPKLKEAILIILSELAPVMGGEYPQEIAEYVFQLSSSMLEGENESYAAYTCIGKLASVSSPVLQSVIQEIYQRFMQRLAALQPQRDGDDEDAKIILDDCLSAVCSIIRAFPEIDQFENYSSLLLSCMPPCFDMDENANVLEFFEEMKANPLSEGKLQEFAVVLIRLLADGIDVMLQNMISEEQIGRFIEYLKQMNGAVPLESLIAQVTGGAETQQAQNVFSVLSEEE